MGGWAKGGGVDFYLFFLLMLVGLVVLVWVKIFARLDRYRRDKKGQLWIMTCFACGLISIIPPIAVYQVADFVFGYDLRSGDTANNFFTMFLLVGPVEEFSKFFVFFICTMSLRSIKEPQDGILQGAAVALAFASVENILYVYWYGFGVLFTRSLLCVTGHIVYSTLWSAPCAILVYGQSKKKMQVPANKVLPYLIPAAFVHGLYNFLLRLDLYYLAVFVDILVLMAAIMIYLSLRKVSPYKRFRLTEWRKAIPRLQTGLMSHPNSFLLNRRIGLYYLYCGAYRKALAHFSSCLKIKRKNGDTMFYKGMALLLAGSMDRGRDHLRRALIKVGTPTRVKLYQLADRLILQEEPRRLLREEFDTFEVMRDLYGVRLPVRKVPNPLEYRDRRARLWSGYALNKGSL